MPPSNIYDIYYTQGWRNKDAVDADIAAGGWKSKVGSGGGSTAGTSTYAPITPVDYQKLETDAYEMLKGYYTKIAIESRGDFNRGVAALNEDYQKGTRQAIETEALGRTRENQDLTSTLKTLGLTFTGENETKADELNKRGAAVGQMAGNDFNVLNSGRGGVEVARLKESQALRQEAVQRASDRKIQDLGISLKKTTNPGGEDRSQWGTAELSKERGLEDLTRQQQLTEQQAAEERRSKAQGIATSLAGVQQKNIPEALKYQYNVNDTNKFVNTGAV